MILEVAKLVNATKRTYKNNENACVITLCNLVQITQGIKSVFMQFGYVARN